MGLKGAVENRLSAMCMTEGMMSQESGIAGGFRQVLTVWGKGCLELFQQVAEFAVLADSLCKEGLSEYGDSPGSHDLEVSSAFGAWYARTIVESGAAPTRREAVGELERLNSRFWSQLLRNGEVHRSEIVVFWWQNFDASLK